MSKPARGQTMVMFALTVLLLSVMVILTLSVGQRINDRMELQSTADAAAYSEAVATARTMNSLAVLNRVEIAHTVAITATMALISFVSLYGLHVKNTMFIYLEMIPIFAVGMFICCLPFSPCSSTCLQCAHGFGWNLGGFIVCLLHWILVSGKISNDTQVYTNSTLPRWNAANAVGVGLGPPGLQQQYFNRLQTELQTIAMGNTMAGNAQIQATPQFNVASRASSTLALNNTKLNGALYMPSVAAPNPYHAGVITDGSRGHPFISKRDHPLEWSLNLTIPWLLGLSGLRGIAFNWAQGTGDSYVDLGYGGYNPGNGPPHGRPNMYAAGDPGDHTSVLDLNIYDNSCFFGLGWISWLLGLIGLPASFEHVADQPSVHTGYDSNQHAFRPTPYPAFWDFNPNNLAGPTAQQDIYGQPTQYAMMSRNYNMFGTGTQYPWEMNLNSGQFLSGTDKMNTLQPASIAMVGNVPTEQIALGKGVVYYNREEHWNEQPNLFAPYWRAGLTRLTVDLSKTAPDPAVETMLTGVDSSYKDLYDGLWSAGYKGFQ